MYLHLGANDKGRIHRFANVSAISGMDYPEDGRSLCLVDWDHDGDLISGSRIGPLPNCAFFEMMRRVLDGFLVFAWRGKRGIATRLALESR